MKTLKKLFFLLWTSPNSLLGLIAGGLALLTGGGAQVREGCIEFYGGFAKHLLRRFPIGSGSAAMTLGHTILGQNTEALDRVRTHEQVHVRQYERWGPFFLPAYLGCSLYLWIRRKQPYRDNPFEVEAYSISDPPNH